LIRQRLRDEVPVFQQAKAWASHTQPTLTHGQRLNAFSFRRAICIGLAVSLVASCERKAEVVDTTLPEDARRESGLKLIANSPTPAVAKAAEASEAIHASYGKNTTTFACSGAYSNVSFSEESGDGSGVVAIVQGSGETEFIFWEGGPSTANAVLTSISEHTMSLALSFPDYPAQEADAALECRGSRLLFRSSELGHNDELRRITPQELADLR
jgi:hypothetical protein